MSGQDLPTYLRGHSLSRAEQSSALGAALLRLCRSATADGRFSPEELAALRQWLADADSARMPAARYLRSIVEKVLADGTITPEEYKDIYRAVESILPVDERLEATAARQKAEAADEAAARAASSEPGQRILGVPMSTGTRIGLIVAALAVLAVIWLTR
jgi:anti-sigma factor RsiW